MRNLLLAVAASLAALAAPAAAQEPPTVLVRVAPLDEITETAGYVAALADQEEAAKQFLGLMKALTGPKGLEGIDTKKPWGAYGDISAAALDSPVVILLPIADEETFLGALKSRFGLEPKKGGDGVYKQEIPGAPVTAYFRFANGYVYATAQNAANIDPKAPRKPGDVLGQSGAR